MKRGNGEGSIFKLSGKRRKPWAVRITAGWTDDGKQILKYLGYYRTRPEAKAALREFLVDPYDVDANKVTLRAVFELWKEQAELSRTTIVAYSGILSKIPHLIDLPIKNIRVGHIEDVMRDLSPGNARTLKNSLNAIYNHAMKHSILDKNIISLITVKKADVEKDVIPFTLEQIRAIKNFGHEYTDTGMILLYTGMRINELLDVKTKNINLKERYIIGGLKTAAGKERMIPIHDEIYEFVKARYNPDNEYFIQIKGKKLTYQRYRRRYWNVLQEQLKFEQNPHAARHTFITFADRQGLNKISVQKIVGHKSGEITDHYTHRTFEELLAEINKLKYE